MKKQKNLITMAYAAVKEMILRYQLSSGQRLILTDLAAELGVSRTPVYSALSMLAMEGYLDFVPNHGFTVHCLTRQEADDLFEARGTMEFCTIGKAIRLMTEETCARLRKTRTACEYAIANRNQHQLSVVDTQFHAGIIAMTGNQHLVQIYMDISRMISLRFRIDDLSNHHLHEIARQHEALFEAVSIKDVETARILIERHNRHDREVLLPSDWRRIRQPEKPFDSHSVAENSMAISTPGNRPSRRTPRINATARQPCWPYTK